MHEAAAGLGLFGIAWRLGATVFFALLYGFTVAAERFRSASPARQWLDVTQRVDHVHGRGAPPPSGSSSTHCT